MTATGLVTHEQGQVRNPAFSFQIKFPFVLIKLNFLFVRPFYLFSNSPFATRRCPVTAFTRLMMIFPCAQKCGDLIYIVYFDAVFIMGNLLKAAVQGFQ